MKHEARTIGAVSVVIPTTGRLELPQAVESARSQIGITTEVIIVADMSPEDPRAAQLESLSLGDQLLYTGGKHGAATARNIGARSASHDWVAFLDDDDIWDPNKLDVQAREMHAAGATVAASRVRQVHAADASALSSNVPKHLLPASQDPAEYLFRRRRPGAGRASLFTSTLVVRRDLAMAVPWDEDLSRHQDWDWMIRLSEHPDYAVVHCPESLVEIRVGSSASISARSNWEDSLNWGLNALATRKPSVLVDFAFGQPLRYALQARSLRGVRSVLRLAYRLRRIPSTGPLIIGMSGILGRTKLERAMKFVR